MKSRFILFSPWSLKSPGHVGLNHYFCWLFVGERGMALYHKQLYTGTLRFSAATYSDATCFLDPQYHSRSLPAMMAAATASKTVTAVPR